MSIDIEEFKRHQKLQGKNSEYLSRAIRHQNRIARGEIEGMITLGFGKMLDAVHDLGLITLDQHTDLYRLMKKSEADDEQD